MDTLRTATERHLLHFQVPPEAAGDRILTFHVGAHTHRVQVHTPATYADACAGNPLLQLLPAGRYTHYVDVDLPADCVVLTYVTARADGAATEDFIALAVHLPRETRRSPALRAGNQRRTAHPKLNWLLRRDGLEQAGQALAHLSASDLEADFLADLIDPFETASALLMQHPSLINLNADSGAPTVILGDCIGRALDRRMRLVERIERLGSRWSRSVPLLDDGTPVVGDDGPVYTRELDESLPALITEPLSEAIRYANQLQELRDHTWRMHYGSTTDEQDGVAQGLVEGPVLLANETRWAWQALTRMNGLRTGADVEFRRPRAGGWTINETWSSDDAPGLDATVIAALAEGRMFVRVDAVGRPGVWSGTFPAQTLRDDEPAHFKGTHETSTAGADFATVALTLDDLRMDLTLALELHVETDDELESVHLGVRDADGIERLVWRTRPAMRGDFGNLRIAVVNEWVRHLSTYVEFYDVAGNAIALPDWESRLPAIVRSLFDTHPTKKYIGMLPPVDTLFGFKLPPLTMWLDIPVPANAASLRLFWGGLGSGPYDATVCPAGITGTTIICMAFPVLLMLLGTRIDSLMTSILRDPIVLDRLLAVGVGLIGNYVGLAQNPLRALRTIALALGPALAKKALKKLSIHVARRAGEAAALRAIPFINMAFEVINTTATLLQLAHTTIAVVQSPFVYATQLTRSFDLRVTIKPDEDYGEFPQYRDRMRVVVVYDRSSTQPLSESRPPRPLGATIPVHFHNLPAGGRLKVMVFFYANSGWQSAMGETDWVEARGRNGRALLELSVELKNALIPLSADSVYRHQQALTFERGRYRWRQGAAPTTTIANAGPLRSLVGITVTQRPRMLGYAWQAGGPDMPSGNTLYTMQNISVLDDPHPRRANTPDGFVGRCGIAYDVGSPDDGSGANFYLDPTGGEFEPERDPASGYHLRRLELAQDRTPRFAPGSGESWGRFPTAIDSFVVHPQGYVAGISARHSKIFVLELPAQHGTDTDARAAIQYSGDSDNDDDDVPGRIGLLLRPRAIAVALDGRLLVLEDGNRRVHSFDICGNPVPYFRQEGSDEKSPILPLRRTDATSTNYLDLSVEAKGYLFVLAQDGSGASADHYRVDIYEPDGTFLVSTPRVAAEKIAVDLARSLYTLNWESLRGPEGRPEPSVSLWLAPPPPSLPLPPPLPDEGQA